MRLPNGARAVVELAKLTEYCLSPTHPRGRHKARVFALKLGYKPPNAWVLRALLLTEAATNDGAVLGVADVFGQRYVLDFFRVGSSWPSYPSKCGMVCAGEDVPRFAFRYVL